MRIPYDSVGDIVIFKFPRHWFYIFKRIYASRFLRKNKQFNVALEKVGKFEGELRIQKTSYLAGENRKDTIHKENDCIFYFDVDKTYFSPRLSQERKVVAEDVLKKIKSQKLKNPKILVLFAGVSPLPIVLGKLLKKNKIKFNLISSELNHDACDFGKKNVYKNNLDEFITVQEGDSRKLCQNLSKKNKIFDFILMPRPNLEDTFLDAIFKVSKKGTHVYYHGFGTKEEVEKEVFNSVTKYKKKVSKLLIRKAGDIGVKRFRWNVYFKIL